MSERVKCESFAFAKPVSTRAEALANISSVSLKDIQINQLNRIYPIDEALQPLDKSFFQVIEKISVDHFVLAFQSLVDGKFCIVWKFDQLYNLTVLYEISKDDLTALSSFVFDFIRMCLTEDHSGLSGSTNEIDIKLVSLVDPNGINLFLHAAQKGKTNIVRILLEIAFDIKCSYNDRIAADYAYENQHFETVLELLDANSPFPMNFNANECSEEVTDFALVSEVMHENICKGNVEEVSIILLHNPKLRYFYNHLNVSAAAAAIQNCHLPVYDLLVSRNILFALHEDAAKIIFESLDPDKRRQVREIHFKHKKSVQAEHLLILMTKSSVSHDADNLQEKLNLILKAYQFLNEIPQIEILLKIAAKSNDFKIVYDFNRDSVHYLDPTNNQNTHGVFYLNGRIFIGAKQLLDPSTERETFDCIAHEICHFVIDDTFYNTAAPYDEDDEDEKTAFQAIVVSCQGKCKLEYIIHLVYKCYGEESQHAELIVRVPHILSHYVGHPDTFKSIRNTFKSLFDYYDEKVMPRLIERLDEIEFNIENEVKIEIEKKEEVIKEKEELIEKKDKKISQIIVISAIIGIILLLSTLITPLFLVKKDYNWIKLSLDDRYKALNGTVRFVDVELKLGELIIDHSDQAFEGIHPDELKSLINGDIVIITDKSKIWNEIDLTYKTAPDKLKKKIEEGFVEFQGNKVQINRLIKSKSDIYDKLDSQSIFKLMTNQSQIKISEKMKDLDDFFVKRFFIENEANSSLTESEKSEENPKPKDLNELFNESKNSRIVLLSDGAGNGKTVTFEHLSRILKTKNKLNWVEFVLLKNNIEDLKSLKKRALIDYEKDLKHILGIRDGFEKEVFNYYIKNSTVTIFWDGFDEISPEYTDIMLSFIKELRQSTNIIQFISTRPQYEVEIIKSLEIKKYKLKPYEESENKEFLQKFYEQQKFNESKVLWAQERVQTIVEKIQNGMQNYIESPLLLKMVVEIAIDESLSNLSESFKNLYSLYETFVVNKGKIAAKKGDIVVQKAFSFEPNETYHMNALKYLFRLGFDDVMSVDGSQIRLESLNLFIKNKNQLISNNEKAGRIGIMTFDSAQVPEFTHRTFAEFFIAQYFVQNVLESSLMPNEQETDRRLKLMMDALIFNPKLKVKEFFLEYKNSKNLTVDRQFVDAIKKRMIDIFFFAIKVVKKSPEETVRCVKDLISIFDIDEKSLMEFWKIEQDQTFFNWWAIQKPKEYLEMFKEISKNIVEENDINADWDVLLYGENQKGSFLFAAYRDQNFPVEQYLNITNVDFKSIGTQKFLNFIDFFNFINTSLTTEEKHEMIKSNLFEILTTEQNNTNIWEDLESIVPKPLIKETLCTKTKSQRSILYFIENIECLRRIFDIIKDCPNAKDLLVFPRNGENSMTFDIKYISSVEYFDLYWNFIEKIRQRNTILSSNLKSKSQYNFNALTASIMFGNKTHFERIRDIYKNTFKKDKMKNFCVDSLNITDTFENNPLWTNSNETAKAFVDYVNEIFTKDELRVRFEGISNKLFEDFYKNIGDDNNDDDYDDSRRYAHPIFEFVEDLVSKEPSVSSVPRKSNECSALYQIY